MRTDGGPAFPMQEPQAIHAYAMAAVQDMEGDTDERDRAYMAARGQAVGGMSLRDYFACEAMRAAMRQLPLQKPGLIARSDIAELAYLMADEMLKARFK